jgi:hypothetical protein
MALFPGPTYVNDTRRIEEFYETVDGEVISPTSIVFKIISPRAAITTYTYGTNAQIVREDAGVYYVDWKFTEAGRWRFRWESSNLTGSADYTSAREGSVVVKYSPFYDSFPIDYV